MTKQEFLAMSLPFNAIVCVKYTHKPDSSEYENLIGLIGGRVITGETEEDDPLLPISDYHVILHPLSDLTKEIEHGGEKFVPIVELAKMAGLNGVIDYAGHRFLYLKEWKSFVYQKECGTPYFSQEVVKNQFDLFLKLIEWHFALGLDENDYIDINTLNENPYK